MDGLIAINKISNLLNISSRTLRYWESAGLFKSERDASSGWRLYDENAMQCIRITDLLRRLDIPLSGIKEVLENKSVEVICNVLNKQLKKIDDMDIDLRTRKEAITGLINILYKESSLTLSAMENILSPVVSERKNRDTYFNDINKIKGVLNMENQKSKYSDIQIIYIPPMRTAAYACIGIEPEDKAMIPVIKWIEENKLQGTMRLFGFNTEPYPSENSPEYGFGFCASIPEGIEIPNPFYEMRLPGGTYAVISQYDGDPSYGWRKVNELLGDKKWEWEWDNFRNPGLEEHIKKAEGGFFIPILIPVKKKV